MEEDEETMKNGILLVLEMINGENTDNELNEAIYESAIRPNLKLVYPCKNSVTRDKNDFSQWVWVYTNTSIENLSMKAFETVEEAISAAVRTINSYVLYRGNVVEFDTIDDNTAYYIDNSTRAKKLVSIA